MTHLTRQEPLESLKPVVYFKKLFGEGGGPSKAWETMWRFYGISILFWLIVPVLIVANFFWFNWSLLIGTLIWIGITYLLGYMTIIKHESMGEHGKEEIKEVSIVNFVLVLSLTGVIFYLLNTAELHKLYCLTLPRMFGGGVTGTGCAGTYMLALFFSLILSTIIVTFINSILR